MFDKLMNIIELIKNSNWSDIATIIKNNEYEESKKYCDTLQNLQDDNIFYYLGSVNHFVEKNYEDAKKYYVWSIDKGNSYAMNSLAYYYQNVEKNYENCKQYYEYAIHQGNARAAHNLALYYENVEHYYGMAQKYHNIAAELENITKRNVLKNSNSIKNKKQTQHNTCVICTEEHDVTIGFNCLNKHNNHNYCQKCALTWYSQHALKCILCTNDIVLENLSLNVKC